MLGHKNKMIRDSNSAQSCLLMNKKLDIFNIKIQKWIDCTVAFDAFLLFRFTSSYCIDVDSDFNLQIWSRVLKGTKVRTEEASAWWIHAHHLCFHCWNYWEFLISLFGPNLQHIANCQLRISSWILRGRFKNWPPTNSQLDLDFVAVIITITKALRTRKKNNAL